MKYNPKERVLWKSKLVQRAGYKKGTFITEVNAIADIIQNGAQVELRAQEVRELKGEKVEVLELRIYFAT